MFYIHREIDEGVYKKLLDSSHPIYAAINKYATELNQRPLNLTRLDGPVEECIIVPVGTTTNGMVN